LGPPEAERIGLVTEVVETGCAFHRALAYARHLAALPPETLAATKRAINQWLLGRLEDVFQPAFTAEFVLFPEATDDSRP
jgi:enoyl-CoA hydratase/carnithine racemase